MNWEITLHGGIEIDLAGTKYRVAADISWCGDILVRGVNRLRGNDKVESVFRLRGAGSRGERSAIKIIEKPWRKTTEEIRIDISSINTHGGEWCIWISEVWA